MCGRSGMVKHDLWTGGGITENEWVINEWLHLCVINDNMLCALKWASESLKDRVSVQNWADRINLSQTASCWACVCVIKSDIVSFCFYFDKSAMLKNTQTATQINTALLLSFLPPVSSISSHSPGQHKNLENFTLKSKNSAKETGMISGISIANK